MATSIDELQIEIQGTAQSANTSINRLVKNLNNLQGAISKLDTSKFKNLSVNTSNLSISTKKLSSSLNTLNTSATKSTKSFTSLASAFGKFYANYFLVVRGIKSLWSSIEVTADYIEAFNYYTVAFGKIASEWDKDWETYGSQNAKNYANAFVTSMNETLSKLSGVQVEVGENGEGLITSANVKSLGLNIQEITQYASQLASVTNSLGQTGKTTLAISKSFTQLAGDISSLFNVDYSTVAQNLQSGLIGQSRALYKYGIDITNATLQTYAYELGLEKTVTEMTQMEKQQLRVLAILDQSEVSFGDLANTINSPSNQIRQLTNNLEQCGIVLGQLFMPIVEKVLPVVNGLTIAIRQLLVDIAGFLGITINFDEYGEGFNDTEDSLDEVADSLDEATESANALKKALRGFDKLNVITTTSASTDNGVDTSTIDLTSQIVAATEKYQKAWDEAYAKMENRAEEFAEKVSSAFEPIKKIFQDFAIGDWIQVGEDADRLGRDILDFIIKAIDSIDWVEEGESIAQYLEGLDWTETFRGIGRLIQTAFVSIIKVAFGFGSEGEPILSPADIASRIGVLGGLKYLYDIFAGFWGKIWEDILEFFSPITSWLKDNIFSPIGELFTSFSKTVKQVFNGIVIIIKAVLSPLTSWVNENIIKPFTEASEKVAQTTSKVFSNVASLIAGSFNAVISVIESAINTVVKGINGLIGGFNDVVQWGANVIGADWGGVTLINEVKLGRISQYSTGGFPEDGLFFANRNELVGQFSNGQTAVANNEQIVDGIKQGVKEAVSEILAPYLADIADSSRKTANKNFGITSREAFSAVRTEASNYTRRTGQPAF